MTFLFTDIVGSTPLWDRDRHAMALSVARHDEIVRETIDVHDGLVFATAGDSFGAAFGDADRAADAALDIMDRLQSERWRSGTTIRVRAGLHTGVADERDEDYFGPTVNRAARICDAGNGGQVVLSAVTAGLVTRHGTVELGTFRLRGVSDLVVVHQLCGSPGDFAALRSQGAAVSTLPSPVSSLFGRREDIARVSAFVSRRRLVTLTGAGGCGKTRLAIAVGHELGGRFPDGVFFADLSPVASDEQVAMAVAEGIRFATSDPGRLADQIAGVLRGRQSLVVVDNCEHVLDATADLIETVLAAGPGVHVLATSREPLRIDGERVVGIEGLDEAASVELFIDRAGLDVGYEERETVARVCARLDRLPLAIELAAARAGVLSPADILDRLDDRFGLLTSGRRRAQGRQQTLEAAIGWSYDLLDADEQRAMRCLSVVPGVFTLDLAAATIGIEPRHALDLIDALVARSMVVATTNLVGDTAYRLLETIRAFAAERLRADPDHDDDPHRRHALAIVDAGHHLEWFGNDAAIATAADDILAARDWARTTVDADLQAALTTAASIVLQQMELDAEALALAEEGLQLDPDVWCQANLHFIAGACHVRLGHGEAALDSWARAITTKTGSGTLGALMWRTYFTAFVDPAAAATDVDEFGDLLADVDAERSDLVLFRRWVVPVIRAHLAMLDARFTEARDLLRPIIDRPIEHNHGQAACRASFLVACALSATPDHAVRWLDASSRLLAAPPFMHAYASGIALAASVRYAASIALAAAGERDRGIDQLERGLALRANSLTQYQMSDNDAALAVAAIAWYDDDHDTARQIVERVGSCTMGLHPYRLWFELVTEGRELESTPEIPLRHLRAIARHDDGERDALVARQLTRLGLNAD